MLVQIVQDIGSAKDLAEPQIDFAAATKDLDFSKTRRDRVALELNAVLKTAPVNHAKLAHDYQVRLNKNRFTWPVFKRDSKIIGPLVR